MHASKQPSHRVIAIDGPAASGKSSVAQELARRLGFIYVNSGAIYRAITWHLLEKKFNPKKATGSPKPSRSRHHVRLQNGESRILIDNVDPESTCATIV